MNSVGPQYLNIKAGKGIAVMTVLLMLSFGWGLVVGRGKYPPYFTIRSIYLRIFQSDKERELEEQKYNSIHPDFYKTDLNALITIQSESDLASKRKQLADYIWPGQGLPLTKMPSEVDNDIQDPKCQDLPNLKGIDRILVKEDYGLDSVIYHFIPEKENNKLVIYHAGHLEDFRDAHVVLASLLSRGYSVLGVSMPLMGMNSRPFFESDRNGRFQLILHNQFMYLKDPIRFFIEPVVVGLNYALTAVAYKSVNMIGFSGGGWTTVMCAALDHRIQRSYPVAGTLPFFLFDGTAWGDYEQTLPDLYRIANHLELYILGSYGQGRRLVQVFNQFDACCRYGLRYQVYEQKVKSVVAALTGGSYEVFLDSSHREHKLSDHALERIIRDMER